MEGMYRTFYFRYIPYYYFFVMKGFDPMFSITKEEAAIMRERRPDVHIVRTMKQKSHRDHYFCEETVAAIQVLREIRGTEVGDNDES